MSSQFRVERVAGYEKPQTIVYIALHGDYSEEMVTSTTLSEQECGEVAVRRLLAGHRGDYGPLEHPQLSLSIKADHNTLMQLRTHRTGITFDYQSMRYSGKRLERVARDEIPVEEAFYIRPAGRYRDRQGDPYEWTEEDVMDDRIISARSAGDYYEARQRGAAEEHARYRLTTNYLQSGTVSANLRTWLHLMDLRLKRDAQSEIQQLMELVALQVQRWAPEIYAWYQENRLGKARLAP